MDDVFNPTHYSKMKIEPDDVIEACGLSYRAGSALAYIMRAGRKGDRIADLKKAMNFLHREIYGTWYVERVSADMQKLGKDHGPCDYRSGGGVPLEPFQPERLYVPKK